ncbi:hypothetical protein EGI16_07645 [Chryseobacterium sp. G0240]|uniref:hypothetical protein n=1 Tax=Chryseobacterium sp. G0240 TaxID=2487066 RepID=UPI000F4554BB|nr:hypothetical protein [Chryseobacterium sp. G0240]ROI05179.1 hypothetical protein EGI16_07645 [Chryseobacterium sp. G0240]
MQINYKYQFSLLFFVFNILTFGQVGIGIPDPDPSAMLQVSSKNKGMLLPSVALNSTTDQITIPSPAEGLIIWNNGKGGLSETGFYYWDTSKWSRLSTITPDMISKLDNAEAWNITGTNSVIMADPAPICH